MSESRGFVYELEPLRRMQEWQRDAEQVRLAEAQRVLDQALVEVAGLRARRDRVAQSVGNTGAGYIDPARHGAGLAYLGQLTDLIAQREQDVLQLAQARDTAREACLGRQRACDATEHHRSKAAAEHHIQLRDEAMREADADWLARQGYRERILGAREDRK